MDYEHYQQQVWAINEQLQALADLTWVQEFSGAADSSNPHFLAALSEQERFIELASRLTEQFMASRKDLVILPWQQR